jgi:hypothetical protein
MDRPPGVPVGEKVKCPLCAELIQPEAIICRFCHARVRGPDGKRISAETSVASFLQAGEKKKDEVGLGQALLGNLFCPGMGSWKLGGRVRGGLLFAVITMCVVFYAMDYMDVINSEIAEAMNEGNASGLEAKIAGLAHNRWRSMAFWLYCYSFLDVYLVYRSKSQGDRHPPRG